MELYSSTCPSRDSDPLSFRTQPLDLRFRTLMDTDFVIIR